MWFFIFFNFFKNQTDAACKYCTIFNGEYTRYSHRKVNELKCWDRKGKGCRFQIHFSRLSLQHVPWSFFVLSITEWDLIFVYLGLRVHGVNYSSLFNCFSLSQKGWFSSFLFLNSTYVYIYVVMIISQLYHIRYT